MACFSRDSEGPPDNILDTSNLSLTIDNQGMATLQVVKVTKSLDPITNFKYNLNIKEIDGFNGFLFSDTPKKMEGTEYIEHYLVYRGMIC